MDVSGLASQVDLLVLLVEVLGVDPQGGLRILFGPLLKNDPEARTHFLGLMRIHLNILIEIVLNRIPTQQQIQRHRLILLLLRGITHNISHLIRTRPNNLIIDPPLIRLDNIREEYALELVDEEEAADSL